MAFLLSFPDVDFTLHLSTLSAADSMVETGYVALKSPPKGCLWLMAEAGSVTDPGRPPGSLNLGEVPILGFLVLSRSDEAQDPTLYFWVTVALLNCPPRQYPCFSHLTGSPPPHLT